MNPIEDLAWVFQAKNLLADQENNSDYDCVSDFWWESQFAQFQPFFERIQANPAPLTEHLSHRRSLGRLGIYFESLIEFFLKNSRQFENVQNGIQIQVGHQTLGELDFVFYDRREARLIHWEVAVKFYLYDPVTGLFWGPGLKDRLDLKLSRILDHQLVIGRKRGLASRTVVKGEVFFPEEFSEFQAREVLKSSGLALRPKVCRYFRCFSDQPLMSKARVLERLDWLSMKPGDEDPHSISDWTQPQMLQIDGVRWMSVPEHWQPNLELFRHSL